MLSDGCAKFKKMGHLHCFVRPAVLRFAPSHQPVREGGGDGAAASGGPIRRPPACRRGADRAGAGESEGERVPARRLDPQGDKARRGPRGLPRAEPDRLPVAGPGPGCRPPPRADRHAPAAAPRPEPQDRRRGRLRRGDTRTPLPQQRHVPRGRPGAPRAPQGLPADLWNVRRGALLRGRRSPAGVRDPAGPDGNPDLRRLLAPLHVPRHGPGRRRLPGGPLGGADGGDGPAAWRSTPPGRISRGSRRRCRPST